MNKAHIRSAKLQMLKEINPVKKREIENSLYARLIASSLWKNARVIGITVSQAFEWDTRNIIETAWRQQKQVCVPKCSSVDKTLTFYQISSFDQLEVVYYGLFEPKPDETKQIDITAIELLFVPGLVFDRKGYRIGFGGGYYDRFLMNYSNHTVALLHSSQLVDAIPKESFDIPVDHLITEDTWISSYDRRRIDE
ncbi:5-formyltetrahydrofolate cyclo-ligase [Virgibacillus sp. AGTR]|uniref:5-formyltetrahydrofolate cyclo-ligase n=1 Tax=Virgibacillus sp. AGTR TaxID=2812055 RepID=UPI0019663771|nr:5-formyltetrahydrofolate cyclo-ligase [Virgibacillus sp. AGTR]MCC2251031.1 5-formyltetrahydrofolate cyclo-ligase [Virgibacillus sp. AGTR]QRZ17415.1 5-formyltetrahydrofolate cyclo-ligase [Virgibacillus sp. AGTR]